MNPREKGFLLLGSHLGDPYRKPLPPVQLRTLAQRVQAMEKPAENRELTQKDLISLGYGQEMATRILSLLGQEDVLDYYLHRAKQAGCTPLTWVSAGYPGLLRKRLGLDSPGCLWVKGDVSLLEKPAVSLVGSRDLEPENRWFAEAVGIMAAEKDFVLVSGNARGADRAAQDACLETGGKVISIVADRLDRQKSHKNILFISEDGFSEGFSPQRALSRNRLIHSLGLVTFVAQSGLEKGGTWDGTVKNLRSGWSPVAVFRDGSEASLELEQMGAWLMGKEELRDFGETPSLNPYQLEL